MKYLWKWIWLADTNNELLFFNEHDMVYEYNIRMNEHEEYWLKSNSLVLISIDGPWGGPGRLGGVPPNFYLPAVLLRRGGVCPSKSFTEFKKWLQKGISKKKNFKKFLFSLLKIFSKFSKISNISYIFFFFCKIFLMFSKSNLILIYFLIFLD